jgi:alkylation response protein AidB-like acyl-CoA dehydrogenase
MEHSWMACRLPFETQQELFADRPFILASAPITPAGRAERIDGGYRVWGTFRYASCLGNSDWSFASAPVPDGEVAIPHTFLLPLSEVTVNDDWFMSGMAATSSGSFTANGVFVPESRSLPLDVFFSADRHPGAAHEEAFMRYPVITIAVMMAALPLGCAEGCVELMRERLASTVVFGTVPRIELPMSRVRWGKALEKVRCARLLFEDVLNRAIASGDAVAAPSEEERGQQELDLMTVAHLAQEAVGLVGDGMGSSPYKLGDPIQRARRDINVMANHYFHDDDIVSERATRFILGLGPGPNDPIFLQRPGTESPTS